MGAVSLGPVALSLERAFGILGILAFIVFASLAARRNRDLADWDNGALLTGLVLGRLWYVAVHYPVYLSAPLSILYVWQGGFSALGAVMGVIAYTLWHFRGRVGALIPALGVLVAAVAVWAIPTGVATAMQASKDPVALSETALVTLDGERVVMADYVGTPTVVNFWATWCPPCRREMPMLVSLAKERADIDILFVNQGEGRRTILDYLDAEELGRPTVLLDESQRLGAYYGIRGLPTTLVFDDRGVMSDYHFGELSEAALRTYLRELE